ncbi:hypothetical protein [Roseateles sp.]|uniref:hypothetical protein n=1 Tax=Roseateles sp. TaxID=1971397 RepID=UPI002E03F6D0|nr:hypothetical protein [Roseateles sp.]
MPSDPVVSVAAPVAAVQPAAPFPDWKLIHLPPRSVLPFGEDEEFKSESPTVLRGLFVDLAEPGGKGVALAELLRRRANATDALEIHADVLRIAVPLQLALKSLRIHARRIEVGAGGSLALLPVEGVGDVSLDVYANQVVLERPEVPWRITFLGLPQAFGGADLPGHLSVRRTVDASGQAQVTAPRPVHELVPGDRLQAQFQLGAAKRLQFAKDVPGAPESCSIALELARWVNDTQLCTDGDAAIAAEAAVLAERLSKPLRRAHPVPLLLWGVYHELAKEQAQALALVEAQAQRFFERDEQRGAWRAAADDLLAHYENTSALSRKLRDQARTERDTALEAWNTSRDSLESQRKAVDSAKAAFDAGIEKKRTEIKTELALAGVAIGVSLIAGLVAACSGSGGGANQALDAAKKVEEAQSLLARINKAVEMINKVAGFFEKIHKVYELTSKDVGGLGKLRKFEGWAKKDPAEPVPTAADWEVYRVTVEATLGPAIKLEVNGAEDYLAAMQSLAIRARDALGCGAQWTHCLAVLQQREWECERDEADRKTLEKRRAALGDARPDLQSRMFYERMHDQLKLALLQSLSKLGDAYRYHALAEPSREATADMSAATLNQLVAMAATDMVGALESFKTPPTDWWPEPWRLSSRSSGESARALQRLQQERKLTLTLDPDQLPQFDRVRISEIRVWLQAPHLVDREITIDIATSGLYHDFMRGTHFEFVTAPLDRSFAYVPKGEAGGDGHRAHITHGTKEKQVDDKALFAEPTPFTTWEFAVPQESNAGLDLATVTDVTVQFRGSCMHAHPPRKPAPVKAGTVPEPNPLALRPV